MQIGLPSSRDQYVHRVGRTARAGKKGEALLLLQDFERFFVTRLKGLPFKEVQVVSQQVGQPES